MAKRKETLEIEEKLHYMCHKKRIYGCEEMTIGFANAGQGNEIEKYFTIHEMMEEAFYPEERSRTIYLLKNKNGWCAEPAPQV